MYRNGELGLGRGERVGGYASLPKSIFQLSALKHFKKGRTECYSLQFMDKETEKREGRLLNVTQ